MKYGTQLLYGAATLLGVGYLIKKRKKKPRRPRVVTLAFTNGEVSTVKLGKGGRVAVQYDPASPWMHTGVASEFTLLVVPPRKEGTVEFQVAEVVDSDQVAVQAVAEDGTVMGEHKIAIERP